MSKYLTDSCVAQSGCSGLPAPKHAGDQFDRWAKQPAPDPHTNPAGTVIGPAQHLNGNEHTTSSLTPTTLPNVTTSTITDNCRSVMGGVPTSAWAGCRLRASLHFAPGSTATGASWLICKASKQYNQPASKPASQPASLQPTPA